MKLEVTRWDLYVTASEERDDGQWVSFSEIEPAVESFERQIATLTAERDSFAGKAIRFDLDQAGIESRERDAVELVELRSTARELDRRAVHAEAALRDAFKLTDAAERERDKLREMVVWAVQHGACAGFDGNSWPCITYAPNGPVTYEHHKMSDLVNHDGTPASILAAVERAMGEK
jgi:hypothetical protein